MQSRKASAIETTASLIVGFVLALVVGHFAYPFFGVTVTMTQNLWIVAIFTAVSFARGYAMRRIFNMLHTRGILQ